MNHPHSHPQAVITDEDALNRISPDQLRGYLTAAGWQKIQDPDYISKSAIWHKKGKETRGSGRQTRSQRKYLRGTHRKNIERTRRNGKPVPDRHILGHPVPRTATGRRTGNARRGRHPGHPRTPEKTPRINRQEGRARLSPGDPEQPAEQMAQALDKLNLSRRQPECPAPGHGAARPPAGRRPTVGAPALRQTRCQVLQSPRKTPPQEPARSKNERTTPPARSMPSTIA